LDGCPIFVHNAEVVVQMNGIMRQAVHTVAVLLAVSGPASAAVTDDLWDQMLGTSFVVSHVDSADGVLIGCGLEFAALLRDAATRGGMPIRVNGSFYFRTAITTPMLFVLKMAVIDGLGPKQTFTAPANAFVRAVGGTASKTVSKLAADTPGYALFMSRVDQPVVAAYEAIVTTRKVQVGFNRKPGQQDVVTTLDLTVTSANVVGDGVVRQRSNEMVDEFENCMGQLVSAIKKTP
jgi:hypothetical protein